MKKLITYLNTVKFLRPSQIYYQFVHKIFVHRTAPIWANVPPIKCCTGLFIPTLDLDVDYLARFVIDEMCHGNICLLHECHHFPLGVWECKDASHLYNFNLHYFEYGIALAAKYLRENNIEYALVFQSIIQNWMKMCLPVSQSEDAGRANCLNKLTKRDGVYRPIGDAWQPYTISLRLPNWLIAMEMFGNALSKQFTENMYWSIYQQYKYLLCHQELHLLGNHYLENLKTILICSILFGEEDIFQTYIIRLKNQLAEQILPDGVHYELSIMYHKIILEDIIRLTSFMSQAGRNEYKELLPFVQKMIDALASLEYGFNRTPLFNDAGDNISRSTNSLLLAAKQMYGIIPVVNDSLCSSGYYKFYDNDRGIALLFDAGKIGPSYMPGHGHCDCLSFELAVNGELLFVNAGTFQYQGKHRTFFRSTCAHNTAMLNGFEQSECWGEHRVALRISGIVAERVENQMIGWYTSFSGDIHKRKLIIKDGDLTVKDSFNSNSRRPVHSYLRIAPAYEIREGKDEVIVLHKGSTVCCIRAINCLYKIHKEGILTQYAPEFGLMLKGSTLEFIWPSTEEGGYIVAFQL